jgi:hypothetical protein
VVATALMRDVCASIRCSRVAPSAAPRHLRYVVRMVSTGARRVPRSRDAWSDDHERLGASSTAPCQR